MRGFTLRLGDGTYEAASRGCRSHLVGTVALRIEVVKPENCVEMF